MEKQKTDEINNSMKSLKYRRKIRRNVPFQDEKLGTADEKIDEKNSCLNTLYQVRINPFNCIKIGRTNLKTRLVSTK